MGELVTVGLRIVLFAIAGQLAGGLVAVAGFVPRWDMAGLTLQGAQLGALLGVAQPPWVGGRAPNCWPAWWPSRLGNS